MAAVPQPRDELAAALARYRTALGAWRAGLCPLDALHQAEADVLAWALERVEKLMPDAEATTELRATIERALAGTAVARSITAELVARLADRPPGWPHPRAASLPDDIEEGPF